MHYYNNGLNHATRYLMKYPKLLLLLLTFGLGYLLFSGDSYTPFHDFIISMGYAGTFIAGILFAYGFTAAPAVAIFLILAEYQNIFLAGFIGGMGALVGDLIIFNFVRHSLIDEITKLSKEKIVSTMRIHYNNHINNHLPGKIKKYLVAIVAGFIIASPLPDEIGVSLLAGSRKISMEVFAILSYTLNTAGIFLILAIGNTL